jgi:3'-5' exonuclease
MIFPDPTEVLFLDIETVPQYNDYDEVPTALRSEWQRKCLVLNRSHAGAPEELYSRAGIYAEFGKIICVSVAWFKQSSLHVRSFSSHEEQKLLEDFAAFLNEFFLKGQKRLCAHNGKEFDFPYLGRRMLVNGIKLPEPLKMAGKKPWEINHLDTMELWKFGDHKNFTSLNLLAAVFGIPSPKQDIDGSMVGKVYWEDGDLEKISRYCEKDAETVAELYVRLSQHKRK